MKKNRLILVTVLCATFIYMCFSGDIAFDGRMRNRYKASIASMTSSIDHDQDGIDDQHDILQGALAYVQTRPRYKSQYYSSGYPDDGYGVCTDVAAFALRSAGYDLMELVQEDIALHREDYDDDVGDANIDFRRFVI